MTWKERLIGIPLALAGAVLLVATASGMMFTRTDWGRERVRHFALEKLNEAIAGRVEIDEVLEGDLLRTVRMAGVRIFEPDGSEFARIDTIAVHYRWSDFLFGNVTVPKVTLIGPVANLRTTRGAGWNFERVFSGRGAGSADSTAAPSGSGRGRGVVLREVDIRSGDVTLRFPWDPQPGSDPDSSAWHIEEVDGGWERVVRVERLNANLPTARVAAPGGQSRLFQVSVFSGAATVIRESFEVEQLRADLEVVGDTLFFDVWEADLPDSRIFGEGWVTLAGELQYDLALRGDSVTTADLWWLIPRLPPGVANLDFRYTSLPDGIFLEAQNARWQSPDATVSGRFAMTLRERPDGLVFDEVDLEVERVHSTLIASLTGWEPPLHGDLAGRVRLDGPLSELQVDGDLRITPDQTDSGSHVMALGTVRANGGALGARDLEVHFDTLQLDLVRAFVPGLAVRGQVAGSASADGRLAEGMAVSFDIEQADGELTSNRLTGGGTITAAGDKPLQLDVRVDGERVSLTTLAEYYPAIPFRGDYGGAFSAVGALDDLRVEVHLGGAGDSLAAVADLQLVGGAPRYRGSLQGWHVGLPEFRRGLQQSDLDFQVEFEGEGIELAELVARARADVSASFVGGVRLESATAELRVAGGRLQVDTSIVAAEFGELHASGALSLSRGLSDSLRFELRADSLAALDPLLFPAFDRLPLPTLATGVPGPVARPDELLGLKGSARVVGWLVRGSGYFAVRGNADAARVMYRDLQADSLRVDEFNIGENAGHFIAAGTVSAGGASFGEIRFDSLQARGGLNDSLLNVEFEIAKPSATAAGRGWARLGTLQQTLGVDSLSMVLRGTRWDLVEPAEFYFEDSGALAVRDFELTGPARSVSLEGSVGVSGPVSLGAHVSGLDLVNLAVLWPDSLDVAGQVEVHLELSGTVGDPRLQGSVEVADGDLFGIAFSGLLGTFDYESGVLSSDAAMWQDTRQQVRLYGSLPLDLELPSFRIDTPEQPIDLTFEGDSVPLTLITLLTDQLTDIHGHARAAIHIGGTPEDVDLQGPMRVVNGGFRIPRTGITYEGLEGDLQFNGVRMELDSVAVRAVQGGRGTLTGSVSFADLGNPEFALQLVAVELTGYDQFDARIVASGTVELEGPYDMPHIAGDLSVVSGVLFIEEIGRQAEIIDPFEELRGNLAMFDTIFVFERTLGPRTGNRFLDNLVIDLSLNLERDTWLRSKEMNVEIAGRLTLHQDRARDILRMNG
ncbi:MAG: hypothetical protein GTO46_07880, partial [Gemmatimonadetes bacterium]|nr:hypothetical protein [Gemmatimonadota bacterium]NIO31574.1 hypothetical protein [Gemmatimonadota bacterium]